MSAKILDGKKIADGILDAIASMCAESKKIPHLCILSIGNDLASDRPYGGHDIHSQARRLYPAYDRKEVAETMNMWNNDDTVHGIIVQLPVPGVSAVDWDIMQVHYNKDVDGFLSDESDYQPCTPKGIMRLLFEVYPRDELAGLNAVVIGRSEIVGKPVAQMLLEADCTVTTCHSHTQNLAMHTKNADILIVAAGKPCLITADMVKPGAVVIDVGINRVNGKLVGDVDFDGVKEVAGWITPVPGGVGPMTVAMLMDNVWEAAQE